MLKVCGNCRFQANRGTEAPCVNCRMTFPSYSSEFLYRPLLWQEKESKELSCNDKTNTVR